MVGDWNVNVSVGSMPEKVASAFSNMNEELVGAEYTAIAYLGSQLVNGVNHAVLAEQLVTTGRDTKNIVVVIFNEKIASLDACTLVGIERVLEGGAPIGGLEIKVETPVTGEAAELFSRRFDGWVGTVNTPFALLGTQPVNGINYIYAAESTPVIDNNSNCKKACIIVINDKTEEAKIIDLLTTNVTRGLEYAFSW